MQSKDENKDASSANPGVPPPQPTDSSSPPVPLAGQIENAFSKIKVGRTHYYIMAMLLLGVFFDSFEQNTVGVAGPVIQDYWGLSTANIGFLNTVTFVMVALGRVVTGAVADRYGRRKLLIINLAIYSFGSLGCALAPSYEWLLVGRGIVGFGLGGEIAIAVVMASEYFAAKQRGTAVALINVTAAGFGNMLAPLLGIIVFTVFPGADGWRWVFGVLFFPAILIIFFRKWVPETPRFLAQQGRITEANHVISQLAQGSLTGKNIETTEYLTARPQKPVGVVGDTDSSGKQVKRSSSDIFRGKYRRRTIVLCIGVASSYAAQFSILTLMTTVLVSMGYDLKASLWYTLIMQSGSLLGAVTAALVARRLPRKTTLTIASIIGLVGAGVLGIFSSGAGTGIALIIVCGWIFNFAVIICNTTIWVFAPENFPTRIRGFGTSFILAVGSLSGGLFPVLAGYVFDAYGLGAMFAILAVLFVTIGVSIQFIKETFGQPMEEEDEVVAQSGGEIR